MKLADISDFEQINKFGHNFIQSTIYKDLYDTDVLETFLTLHLLADSSEAVSLLEEDKGMLLGRATPFSFGHHKMAMEIGWWVEPEYRKSGVGKSLIDAFEYWAKKVGCSLVVMGSLDDVLGSYYEKNGYKSAERLYMKELN